MHYLTAAIPFLASGLLPLAQAFVEQSTSLDKKYTYDYQAAGQEKIDVKASMKILEGKPNDDPEPNTTHRIKGQIDITVGADEFSVTYILDRNTYKHLALAPNGVDYRAEADWTNQSVSVQGPQIEYTKAEMSKENFPGEWWTVGYSGGKKSAFQVVTAFAHIHDDSFEKSYEINPSYWPYKNSSIRFQFYVEPQNIYFATFVDYGYVNDQKSHECSNYVQTAVRNELWVGPKVLGQRTWLTEDGQWEQVYSYFCDEGEEEYLLLHEAGDSEELGTKDGVAEPAMIAVSAAAGLAFFAYCAFRVTKRASVDDYFARV